MLSTKLLAFGITHLTDARYFAAWEADYLCFPVGPAGLPLEQFLAIREWVEGPVCVLELGGDAGAEISPEELESLGITHVLASREDLSSASFPPPVTVILHVPVAGYQSAEDEAEQLEGTTGPVLLDFTAGGITYADLAAGTPYTIGELQRAVGERPAYLHIDLDAEDADSAAAVFHGLALRGSSEEKVGYKNFDDLDDLLEALEA